MKIVNILNLISLTFAILFLVYVGYMVLVISSLPALIPMQYNGAQEPTWYATPITFVAWFLGAFFFINIALQIVKNRAPRTIAWAMLITNLLFLIIFHTMFQQITSQRFLYVTVNQGMLLSAIIVIPAVIVALKRRLFVG